MKRNIKNILNGVVATAIATSLWSCSAETPFENNDGMGSVHLHTSISSLTTRAIGGYTDQQLRDNCMVYISRANDNEQTDGLIYRQRGLDKVESVIPLKAGNYVAEAWTGDSIPASFDKKFFRGYKSFAVEEGTVSQVSLNCPIKNVLVVVDASSLLTDRMKELMEDDYTITVSNKGGSVQFTKDNIKSATAYFMMDDEDHSTLTYKFEGTRKIGNWHFSIDGEIENVQSAYRYALKFGYDEDYTDPNEEQTGGVGFVNIKIDEQRATEDEGSVYPSEPTITGVNMDITGALDFTDETSIPEELAIMVCAVGDGFNTLTMESPISTNYDINFLNNDGLTKAKALGVDFISSSYSTAKNTSSAFILFPKQFIKNIPEGEQKIVIKATDKSGKSTTKILTIKR